MTDNYIIAIFVVVLIVAVYLGCWFNNNALSNELFKGFWMAPPDFLAEAGLDSMLFYIGPGQRGYIFIQEHNSDNNGVIMNGPAKIKLNLGGLKRCPVYNNYIKGHINISEIENNIKFPLKQDVEYNPAIGKLVLSKGDNIYAVLYKSPDITERLFATKK